MTYSFQWYWGASGSRSCVSIGWDQNAITYMPSFSPKPLFRGPHASNKSFSDFLSLAITFILHCAIHMHGRQASTTTGSSQTRFINTTFPISHHSRLYSWKTRIVYLRFYKGLLASCLIHPWSSLRKTRVDMKICRVLNEHRKYNTHWTIMFHLGRDSKEERHVYCNSHHITHVHVNQRHMNLLTPVRYYEKEIYSVCIDIS